MNADYYSWYLILTENGNQKYKGYQTRFQSIVTGRHKEIKVHEL